MKSTYLKAQTISLMVSAMHKYMTALVEESKLSFDHKLISQIEEAARTLSELKKLSNRLIDNHAERVTEKAA